MAPRSPSDYPPPALVSSVRRLLLRWGREHFRSFTWRAERDEYRVVVTEILLKQTNADRVATVRDDLLSRYSDPTALAGAQQEQLAALIRPLGFANQRAAQLIALGSAIAALDVLPRTQEELQQLPGIGPYSAAAIACFARGQRVAVIDVIVGRVLARVFGITIERGELRRNPAVGRLANALVRGRPSARQVNWALLDLAALVCRPRPRCRECPLAMHCAYTSGRGGGPHQS